MSSFDLHFQLLGTFQVMQHGRSLTAFRTDKIRALLAYLILEAGRPQRRESLSALFWPEMEEQKALYNLRLSLHRLRQTLAGGAQALQIDRQSVLFSGEQAWVDVLAFELALAEAARHNHPRGESCAACIQHIDTAVTLYRGDLLPGFFPRNVDAAFDDWITIRRERLHRQALRALGTLARWHEQDGRLAQAIPFVRRELELQPWLEEAHSHLMRLLAETGQRVAALNQYERCRQVLRDELDVAPGAETEALYRKIKLGSELVPSPEKAAVLPIPFSPAQTISAFLPFNSAPFVGRERELEQLNRLMALPTARLVTITGVGGIGKTRLALASAAAQAARHQHRFPHGVFFVPLAAVGGRDQLLEAVARALPTIPGGRGDAQSRRLEIGEFLRSRQLLLVLDNFEQLLDRDEAQPAADLLLELLRDAPKIKLLVTSRERLHLQLEQSLALDGLLCPDDQALDWRACPAAQLFQQSARRVQPGFTLSLADLPHLIAICRHLEGMPLGLELAAAWVEWLPLREIAAELESGLDLLVADARDWPDRHRSLRAVFAASWARLSAAEQDFFARLSVFRGGFTRPAAQAVAGGSQTRTAVLRLLTSLTNKSLLRHNRLASRYSMHELLQWYAAEKLAQQGSSAAVQEQHAAYFCAWLGRQVVHLQGDQQQETLALIEANLENIRRAWAWAVDKRDYEALAGAAFGLGMVCLRHGRFAEGAALFTAAVGKLDTGEPAGEEALALARLWHWRALFEPSFAVRQQQLQHSLALLDRAQAPEQTWPDDKAAILLALSIAANGQGDFSLGDRTAAQSLVLYRLDENKWGEANVLFELGVRAWRKGDYALARHWFTHCLASRRRIGDGAGTAVALEGLSGAEMFSGETEKALALIRESHAAYEAVSEQAGMARMKIKEAQVLWYRDLDGLALFENGLACLTELGARRNVALYTVILAMLKADVDIEAAAHLALEGQALCAEVDHQRGVAIAQGVLSRAALLNGRYPEALARAEDYVQAAKKLSLAVETTDALIWAGWAHLALGELPKAERCAGEICRTAQNYWRSACLGLTAVLLACRGPASYPWAWQMLSFGESHYAPHRGPVSQRVIQRFLPQPMQQMPPAEVALLKEEGRRLEEETIFQRLALDLSPP